ncbi:TPA: hypothetical protein DCE37_11105 [Candidatus Latescibacteria bacterium]|nr:hypothetical protein [Candidatus Latescibacterota bacterium]
MTDSRSTTRELSCYGNRIISTPNMDRLSEDGTRFNNAFCTNALSLPRKPRCSRVPSPTSNRRRPTWTAGSAMVRMCHLYAAHRPRTRLSRRPSWTADPSRASSSGRRRVRRRRVDRDTHLRQSRTPVEIAHLVSLRGVFPVRIHPLRSRSDTNSHHSRPSRCWFPGDPRTDRNRASAW